MFSNKKIRLNHYLSQAGVSSRREADKLIQSGCVKVNGDVVLKLGTNIDINDVVKFNGQKIKIQNKIYLLINKPKGFITTTKDQFRRKTVMDLIPNIFIKKKLFPVGRLDSNTTGVLIITNDGNISEILTHPKYHIQKIYNVTLNKKIDNHDIKMILNGKIFLKEGRVKVTFISKKKNNKIKIGLCLGWNRIIKRIFYKLNYKVIELERIFFGKFSNKNIKIGNFIKLENNTMIDYLKLKK
ncbi:pseudouridine synthase [Blattabacterium cuenoti]|uniref:pseudouridine synthase n=1 Tax=Blattabacterium cuenoti TaxID=1653831 RepID=UPI00163D1092|nr:pseudouridine synthase [Blattabacterium cuenoti]